VFLAQPGWFKQNYKQRSKIILSGKTESEQSMSEKIDFGIGEASIVDLLRHGECEGGNVYRGSTDLPLNNTGWEQMRSVVSPVQAPPWQQIITSPLSRCLRFAEELGGRFNLPVIVMDDFREIHFGDWEGRLMSDIWREQENHVKKFFSDPEKMAPPNGEPFNDFQGRVEQGWETLLDNYAGSRSLLVTHGGVIRGLLLSLLNMPPQQMGSLDVPYASLSQVQVFAGAKKGERAFSVLKFLNGSL